MSTSHPESIPSQLNGLLCKCFSNPSLTILQVSYKMGRIITEQAINHIYCLINVSAHFDLADTDFIVSFYLKQNSQSEENLFYTFVRYFGLV